MSQPVVLVGLILMLTWCSLKALAADSEGKFGFVNQSWKQYRSMSTGNTAGAFRAGLTTELVHTDHPGSSYYSGEKLTTAQKVYRDATADKLRIRSIAQKIKGSESQWEDRRMVLDAQSPFTAISAAYNMEISIGTPPQSFVGIADTGSDLIWFECDPCTNCTSKGARFYPSKSTTYSTTACGTKQCSALDRNYQVGCTPTCEYNYTYGDGSFSNGEIATESVSFIGTDGTTHTVSTVAFGCGHTNTAVDDINSDGIIGLGRGSLSFPSQIGTEAGFSFIFSYCMTNRFTNMNLKSTIVFGNASLSDATVYTPLVNTTSSDGSVGQSSLYYVDLQGISVDGTQIKIPEDDFALDSSGSGGLIFDSGTTFTHLEKTAYNALLAAVKQQMSNYDEVNLQAQTSLDLCYYIPSGKTAVIPDVTFHFAGADFALGPDNIFIDVGDSKSSQILCFAIQSSEDSSISIFGNVQQMDFQVTYDGDKGRVGWVATTCGTGSRGSGGGGGSNSASRPTYSFLLLLLAVMVAFFNS